MRRKPPSQRDPQYAEQRIMRASVQRVPGTGKVASAAPRTAKPREVVRGIAPAPSGGGGALGHCRVEVTGWSGALTSSGSTITSTGLAITSEVGDHGVSTSGGDLTYGSGLYLIRIVSYIEPSTNATTTDVHQILFEEVFVSGTAIIIGTLTTPISGFGQFNHNGFAGTSYISLTARCNAGTDRSYNINNFRLFITRLPYLA